MPGERRIDRDRLGYVDLRPSQAHKLRTLRPGCPHEFQAHLAAVAYDQDFQGTRDLWLSFGELWIPNR